MLQYSGVVAWYCALKLELYASYVLSYDDMFGVFEWGAGGIVHLHLPCWRFPGFGRYDYQEGEVPNKQRREDARAMAWQHGAELSEWNIARLEEWDTTSGFDEDYTPFHPPGAFGPAPVSDGSDCDTADPKSTHEEDGTEASPDVLGHMQELVKLLQDPGWHPSALPVDIKRVLLTSTASIVRRMRRR